jgi:hypothetical protein
MEEGEIQDHDPDNNGNRLQCPPENVEAKGPGAQNLTSDLPITNKRKVLRLELNSIHPENLTARQNSSTFLISNEF